MNIGGVNLGPADIQQAIDILEGAKGIMVRQPLQRADHPLGSAAPGWYHPFAQKEIAVYPAELMLTPGTHSTPTAHVKTAVIHRLRRML
jgi:hypothetical protein